MVHTWWVILITRRDTFHRWVSRLDLTEDLSFICNKNIINISNMTVLNVDDSGQGVNVFLIEILYKHYVFE